MKNAFVVAVALCAAGALAMPTKDELAKAQPLVAELMAEDVAAYKAKSKKAEEIGDISVKYAQEASTEAAKFLLLKGAISYYVRGESYDKAADAVNALREAIPDVPPDVLDEIIRKNTARVTAKKAPRLYAMYRTAQVQMEAVKSVRTAKAALAKAPKDEAAIRKLAEAQALSGDWKSALGTFAQMGNKAGAMAKSETEGKDLAAVADFWWDYESYLGENDADAFKMHAAAIYRKSLADGSIDGLKKKLVENRLKQVEVVAVASAVSEVSGSKVSESEIRPKVPKQSTTRVTEKEVPRLYAINQAVQLQLETVKDDFKPTRHKKRENGGMRPTGISTRAHSGDRSSAEGLVDEHQTSLAEKHVQQSDVSVVDVHAIKSDISVSQSTIKLVPKAAEQGMREKQGCREDLVPAEKIEPEQAASRDCSGILIGLVILMCLVNFCLLVRRR